VNGGLSERGRNLALDRNPQTNDASPSCRSRTILRRISSRALGERRSKKKADPPNADFRVLGSPVLLQGRFSRTLKGMDVHLTNPDLQAKLDRWVTETGRGPDELVEDAMAGYFDELARTCEMLNSRYDDLKSGRVKPISRDELVAHFREKSAAARRTQPGE
jgi:hypothetical protein